MLSPGMLIALYVTILYLVMAPLVLYALYVVFDSLGQYTDKGLSGRETNIKKDFAVWTDEGAV